MAPYKNEQLTCAPATTQVPWWKRMSLENKEQRKIVGVPAEKDRNGVMVPQKWQNLFKLLFQSLFNHFFSLFKRIAR